MTRRLPDSYYNPVSYAGTVIALVAIFMFIFLYVLASLSRIDRAYEGIVIFMVTPVFIVFGLALIPIGMFFTARKRKRAGVERLHHIVVDLNKPSNRRALLIFSVGTLVFLFLSALGSYKAYHFTESVLFCGTLCHRVMNPEYTAYQTSPHARVTCAECHVGPGASWYVKSKLSGLYQVYATLANVYPRPIPTPVTSLRPARETCEQCHWPQKVYGKQQRLEIHYLPDEANTPWNIEMLLNTGAGNQALGFETGIHWHINRDVRIEYFHTDEKRLDIARVILTNGQTGEKTVFDSTTQKVGEADLEKYPPRFMDCIDCHNCPSHIYRSPLDFVNQAITEGKIDIALPFIKKTAVEACLEDYASPEGAREGVAAKIRGFYAEKYPQLAREQAGSIEKSIDGTIEAFSRNIFPVMKARWSAYPNHIGHINSPGCFRCHDNQHVSASGRVIRKNCTLCHEIYGQGSPGAMAYGTGDKSLEFKHPVDIGEAWKEMACADCHSSPPIDF
jgi:hypothetical protein